MRNHLRENSLKSKLLTYLKNSPDIRFAKGELERMVLHDTFFLSKDGKRYTADNSDRRLRELKDDNFIKGEEINGHIHYWYSLPPKGEVIIKNGIPVFVPPEVPETKTLFV